MKRTTEMRIAVRATAFVIALSVARAVAAAALAVPVTFGPVPQPVVAVRAIAWPDGAPVDVPVRAATDRGGRVIVRLAPGHLTVILAVAPDGRYLLDGPFVWPAKSASRTLRLVWRRTIAGHVPIEPGAAIDWVGASSASDGWPSCRWRASGAWECLGVEAGASGVVVLTRGAGLRYAVVLPGREASAVRRAAWGRMVVLRSLGAAEPAPVACKALRLDVPARRPQTIRLRAVAVASVECVPLNTAVWVAAGQNVASGWIEVRAGRFAPVRLPLDDLSAGPPQLPVEAPLAAALAIRGSARDPQRQPIAGVQLSLFRLLDEPFRSADPHRPPRRVLEAEKTSGEDGAIEFTGLADGTYELVGLDPQAGRALLIVTAPAEGAELRFAPRATARGRVVREGEPQAGVPVTVMPDLGAFERSEDPTRLRGGSVETGPDGTFSVALPVDGGGDLLVGGGDWPVRRVPLPNVLPPLFDAGTIELGGGIDVTAVLDGADGCTLVFTGPLGRAGLQIVRGRQVSPGLFSVRVPEAGSWATALVCGRQEVRVAPAVVTIDTGNATATVTLTRR
ncbi:MAG TPA: hypothetical protein VFX12_13235 [Vicinamibacterales bacterium]|nr:hypothetical protein [Vicinamibacterales bacterium]